MIHERKIYQCFPGRVQRTITRFENDVVPLWLKHGYRPLGFWTPIFGENSNQVQYLLEWKDLDERARSVASFVSDPEWVKAKELSEPDGPLVESVMNYLLSPCAFFEKYRK